MKIDFSKPVRTRNGKEARVLSTDCRRQGYPVMVEVLDGGNWLPHSYTAAGKFFDGSECASEWDLENVPEGFFVNVYATKRVRLGDVWPSIYDARQVGSQDPTDLPVGMLRVNLSPDRKTLISVEVCPS